MLRPGEDQREVLGVGQLDPDSGLVRDAWMQGNHGVADQLTLMNSRASDLLAGDRGRWPLPGDQLYVDSDLSEETLPAGTRVAVGEAVVEVSPVPDRGCANFAERFGHDGLRFVNTPTGRALCLRGVVRPGDAMRRMA